MPLQYDEFGDNVIAPFWESAGWNPPDGERDGYVYKESLVASYSFALHQWTSESHDVWVKVDIGTYTVGLDNSIGGYIGWTESQYNDPGPGVWNGALQFSCFWQDAFYFDVPGGEGLWITAYAEIWSDGWAPYPSFEGAFKIADADPEGLAIDAIYLRQKWDADTNITRFFWSLTEPTTDDDWTELVWDAPQETFEYIDTRWLPDGEIDDWDEMRGILRTIDFTPTAPVGFYMWINNEYVPNIQKLFYFRQWPPAPDLYPRIGALESLVNSVLQSMELLATKDELGLVTDVLESNLETLDEELESIDSQIKVLQDSHI